MAGGKCSGPLAPRSIEEEARVMQWSIWVVAQCEDACVNLMFAGMMRNPQKQAARKASLFQKLERPFGALDRYLSTHRYLLGDERWSIADLNVASIIEWGIDAGMVLEPYPALRRWWAETLARPAKAKGVTTKTSPPTAAKL
jgi:glutathione S-transferase